jgi:hypothetical protein
MKTYSWDRLSRMAGEQFEFLPIGPTPHEEECTQCGCGHEEDGIVEARIFAEQLQRMFPIVPGAEFVLIRNHHDFGTYYEAGITYIPTQEDDEDESPSEAYAMQVECGCDKWDEISKQALIEAEHHLHTGKLIHMKKTA